MGQLWKYLLSVIMVLFIVTGCDFQKPKAVISTNKIVVQLGESVLFDASHSTAGTNRKIVSYIWKDENSISLSDKIKFSYTFLKAGMHHISLQIVDNQGQTDINSVAITVENNDVQAPVITLNGDANLTIEKDSAYTELGATAVDDRDGNVSVEIKGTVETSTVGTYVVTYTAKDSAGNVATKKRIINVAQSVNPEIKKLKEMLNDPNVPYTTDVDFNKTMYAKHRLPEDEAKKLERVHYLVAIAKDPDKLWFSTKISKKVIIAEAGESYILTLKKVNKAGVAYAPVDNDKLRLVARVQKSKNEFEYISNVNIDQYAHWDGEGILKIHVPNDLDKGRLIVGIRPDFNDVAMSAIAERWSTYVMAEVWQIKENVIEVNSNNVLFPLNNSSNLLPIESLFTKNEIGLKAKEYLDANSTIVLPIVVKNMTINVGDLLAYMYDKNPYCGRVIFTEIKNRQTFALMEFQPFDVYDVLDGDDGFMIKNGLMPEHVVYREGDALYIDVNESDPTEFKYRSLSKKKLISNDLFEKKCNAGRSVFTFSPVLNFVNGDGGLDVTIYGTDDYTQCTYTAKPAITAKGNIAEILGGTPFAVLIKSLFGSETIIAPFGQLKFKAKGVPGFGLKAGWTYKKGANFKILSLPSAAANAGNTDISSSILASSSEAEISSHLGVKMVMTTFSKDSGIGKVLNSLPYLPDAEDIGVSLKTGTKFGVYAKIKNAREVYETKKSSKLTANIGLIAKFKVTYGLKNFLKMMGFSELTEYSKDLTLAEIKAEVIHTFDSVYDDGQGRAHLLDLMPTNKFIESYIPKSRGVLAPTDDISSVFNDSSADISYNLSECAHNPDHKIVSPAIACAGWMCGVVTKEVELCKGKLSISDVVAHAKINEIASEKVTIVNKAGDITVNISGDPLKPAKKTIDMAADTEVEMIFSKRCSNTPGVKRVEYGGGSSVSVEDIPSLHDEASNIMVCHDDDTHGDPHIVTGDKLGYDYYASGDYILSRIKGITGYEIQARFLPGYKTSWPQAVALRVGSDIIEVQGVKRDGHGAGLDVSINAFAIWVNGKKGILGNDGRLSGYHDEDSISKIFAKLPSGGILAATHTDSSMVLRYASELTVIWPEGSPAQNYGVVLSVAKQSDPFVHIQIARPDDFAGQERGLTGNNDGNPKNDFIRRNGEVLGVDHNISFTELYALFGTDWLVRPHESLFRNPEAIKPQFPTDVVTLTPEQRRLGEQACGALTGFYREACIIDVGLTGDANIVKEYYANTEDLNNLSDTIVTPDVDQAHYTMSVADKAYEADSGYYLHYTQNIHIVHEAGEGKFMLLVRPPRRATALLSTGDMSLTAEGNYTTHIEVDCTELNSATNQAYFQSTGSVQLWLQDPLSGTASKMISQVTLPCTDASKRAGYTLKKGIKSELSDSNNTNLHYTQSLSIIHTNSYAGEYILEITPPQGAVVKLNDSTAELNVTGSQERNDTLELDCSMAESNASNGSIKLWEKDKLSGTKAYSYANYSLSCRKSKVLKTGQTTSYADFDDGYYQTGEGRSYTRDDSKEIVVDNSTGLMWQDNSEAKTVRKPWVTQANWDAGKHDDTSGDTATTYCTNLILGGYDDWRLPSRKELGTLVDYGRVNPSLDTEFLNFASNLYWSSTTYVGVSGYAWFVHFGNGYQSDYIKTKSHYVRCVRTGQ